MKNEKSNNVKEKMLKSCKKLNNFITAFKCIVAACVFIPVIVILILALVTIFQPNDKERFEAGENWINTIDYMTNKVNEFEDSLEKIEETKVNAPFKGIRVMIIFLILANLSKILKSTIQNETPFSEENVKHMKKIDLLASINWIATTPFIINVGLIYVLAISVITYIFEYGYQLQLESDETL